VNLAEKPEGCDGANVPAPTKGQIDPRDFEPKCDFDPSQHGADDLIAYLAWAVTACAVAGLLVIGIQMAMQFQRGEGATYYRGGTIVAVACVIGATAGPLVEFLVKPYLI